MQIPEHIQQELDELIDELTFNEDSFDEIHAEREALLSKTDYFIQVEAAIFKRRKYYVVERSEYSFDGIRAYAERPRYLVEPTSSKTFQTFEL